MPFTSDPSVAREWVEKLPPFSPQSDGGRYGFTSRADQSVDLPYHRTRGGAAIFIYDCPIPTELGIRRMGLFRTSNESLICGTMNKSSTQSKVGILFL